MEEVMLIGPWQHLSCALDGMWPAAYRIQQARLRFIEGQDGRGRAYAWVMRGRGILGGWKRALCCGMGHCVGPGMSTKFPYCSCDPPPFLS